MRIKLFGIIILLLLQSCVPSREMIIKSLFSVKAEDIKWFKENSEKVSEKIKLSLNKETNIIKPGQKYQYQYVGTENFAVRDKKMVIVPVIGEVTQNNNKFYTIHSVVRYHQTENIDIIFLYASNVRMSTLLFSDIKFQAFLSVDKLDNFEKYRIFIYQDLATIGQKVVEQKWSFISKEKTVDVKAVLFTLPDGSTSFATSKYKD